MKLPAKPRTAVEVFLLFLRLGCTSFGGPVAHLGYFERELVAKRRWCEEDTFAEIIALAQSLPGPSSSQVCFALGILRAGWLGGIAAWSAFTLPSALIMFSLAFGADHLSGNYGMRIVHGLQLVAVAIVAQAVMTMQRSLAPDRQRMALALGALAIVIVLPPQFATLAAIVVGGLGGIVLFRSVPLKKSKPFLIRPSRLGASLCAATFLTLLFLLPLSSQLTHRLTLQVISAFYTCGALVFGGGHVVLPLLENAVVAPGWVKEPVFLSGYGAAQTLPGPLFSFGGFLGASIQNSPNRFLFGLVGLFALSVPGLLAMASVLPFWQQWREIRVVHCFLRGVNAAVVGVLIAALYSPLWTSSVHSRGDFLVVLICFVLLTQWKLQPIVIVGFAIAASLVGTL